MGKESNTSSHYYGLGGRFQESFLPMKATVPTEKVLTRLEELTLIKRLKSANRQKYGKKVSGVQVNRKQQDEEPHFSDYSENDPKTTAENSKKEEMQQF